METNAWVFIVDDDSSIRKALMRLFRLAGLQTECFPSAAAFLEYDRPEAPSCLVLDLQMPDCDGLELQRALRERHIELPIIFITGHGDVRTTAQGMKEGAVDFLPKPFEDEDLLRAVRQALEQSTRERDVRSSVFILQRRMGTLSPREQEVLGYVVSGMLNKQIGCRLGVTEKTIKVHRGQVMHKMEARSLAELVRMAEKLGIRGPQDQPQEGRRPSRRSSGGRVGAQHPVVS